MCGCISNDHLIDFLLMADYIQTPLIERVFRAVDRAAYFLPGYRLEAYLNQVMKHGNLHLSSPSIYSLVMESLSLEPGLSFLNLGSGTGYLSTMVGLILGSHGLNHGVEYYADVVQHANMKLEDFKRHSEAIHQFDFCEPKFIQGNCLALSTYFNAKYDRVYCGAECPQEYLSCMKNLLKVGGILVIPFNNHLVKIQRRSTSNWDVQKLLRVTFTHLIEPTKEFQEWIQLETLFPDGVQEHHYQSSESQVGGETENNEENVSSEPYYSVEDAVKFNKEKLWNSANTEETPLNMASLVVPKKILHHLSCSSCLNYLSIGPVTINTNRKIICGRQLCRNIHDLETSMYNKVAQKCFFNCVNYYSGCDTVFQFSDDMKNHESLCKFQQTYECPQRDFNGNGCQLIGHCKRDHPDLFAADGVFRIDPEAMEKEIIFPSEANIIVINIQIVGKELRLFCKVLTSKINYYKKYSIIFFHPQTGIYYGSKYLEFETEQHKIDLSVLNNHLGSKMIFGCIRLSNLERKQINETNKTAKNTDDAFTIVLKKILNIISNIDIKCCNCSNSINSLKDISICVQSHFACQSCFSGYCSKCETYVNSWLQPKTLFKDFNLICDWKNCNKKISCLDYVSHKQICSHREYHCSLENCHFSGSYQELVEHWHSSLNPLKFGNTIEVKTYSSIFWIIDDVYELLHVKLGNDYLEVSENMTICSNSYNIELSTFDSKGKIYRKSGNGELIQEGNLKIYSGPISPRYFYRLNVTIKKYPILMDSYNYNPVTNTSSDNLLKRFIEIYLRLRLNCGKCKRLKDFREIYIGLNDLADLAKELMFSCDWHGCTAKTTWWNFLTHKQQCSLRQYKCFDCQFLGKVEEFKLHWHNNSTDLKFGTHLDFKSENLKKIYWITEHVNELLIVKFEMSDEMYKILVVNEDLAVFPNNYIIELYEHNKEKHCYEKIAELKQSGNKKIYSGNINCNVDYRLSIVTRT